MNDFNKNSTRWGLIMLVLAAVVFCTIAAIYGAIKGGVWWSIFAPLAATIYGCVCFVKKFKPEPYKIG